jgi:hypothetical protein
VGLAERLASVIGREALVARRDAPVGGVAESLAFSEWLTFSMAGSAIRS